VTVLLWGLPTEPPLAAVQSELARLGVATRLLDQRALATIDLELRAGPGLAGWLRTPEGCLDLASISSVYARPQDLRRLPGLADLPPESAVTEHARVLERLVRAWADMTPALVVNRPAAATWTASKPDQLRHIRRFGFAVPETLVTTDPEAVRVFWERHGSVIYKSVSDVRSRVSRLRRRHAARLADVVHCPTQFQRYVPGRDHRVHVVDTEVFGCEVASRADDYRYPGRHAVHIRACRLPREVQDRCRALAATMRLPVAGIDLRRTPAGQWYCFEVNPSPAFTYYQEWTGQPIGAAIARLLAAPPGS
jgi:hypothetical protein